ncbi:hypothetical protein Pla108_21610 [Botrimarina colliarenosi]|uniref:Uncharacterized protein n=1 Tax=Botrimarina colliarenosi TaxID=2528001 RepID=A0A5C6AEZ6_9BACT|nr:hypothetical protein [Botrimarina colliarenosi]TWT98006.1 hypothetical protein Pla108_21610 [Botrimarina colliarenosi]
MPGLSDSGQSLPYARPIPPVSGCDLQYGAPGVRVWQRWRSLYDDILAHVRACDRLGVDLTVGQLAEELDEALGLVERRLEELGSLQILYCHGDGRIELDSGYRRMCG